MLRFFQKPHNYPQLDAPRYAQPDIYQPEETSFKGELRTVSYNIKFSRKITKAIGLLTTNPHLHNADMMFLQEMDPQGVHEIAHALRYNYVYYPALVHPAHKKDFGNAILSKWPIISDKKVILPSKKATDRQRIAVGSVIKAGDHKIQVFSVHIGIFIKASERKNIIEMITSKVDPDIRLCIIAGDFNTYTPGHHEHIHNFLKTADYHHATCGVTWTYKHWYLLNKKSTLDHIYAKGFKLVDNGTVNDRSASDHLPVWAVFRLEK